ncbi:uncharacterized protein LOC125840510 [Solanum verrucosum]|uniref:uncharacterized protein LOC125840509 n=1 Tax=Solanum verrucosum TaxID=315347 RepID=UPI0020D0E5CF|nr:uncharacterized protein LOC125840509 [Solanum verrucosum]XP_049375436.1 uncharacterized protein LOC125840510 [Solanum verrucosum]
MGLNYEDLCPHPYLELPKGFKVPKFETFSGVESPFTHLRAYCDQLIGVGKEEALLIRLFSRTLKEEALKWFISKEIKQWPSGNALAKDFIESYREYAYHWRKEAIKVRPPMTEKEIIEVFVRNQEPEYNSRMLLILGGKFSEIVKVGETIEDDLKTRKIIRMTPQDESSGPLRRKREDVSSISFESSQK